MPKSKHLTDLERHEIELNLKEGVSLRKIALKLDKSTSTISREIRAHALDSNKSARGRIANRCLKRYGCKIRCLCLDKPDCTRRCSTCKHCNEKCYEYEEDVCSKLCTPPYVCNGCVEEFQCTLNKKYYISRKAQEAYREMLVESREGVNIDEDELISLDALVSPLLKKGQSVHHIAVHNANQITVSEKSIYRYVAGGLMAARNIDLPRVCRLKPRTTKPVEHKVDRSCRIGRSFDDFNKFMENKSFLAVEMDSVLGRKGGKVLLTLMFKPFDFMLALIRDRNTSQSVIDCFNYLYELLGANCFKAFFPIILTDNGSEFSNPKLLEFDAQENRRTRIFYCDPNASFQKPKVELNHEFIRKVLPKGTSFDDLTQDDINLMMSHINSYSREMLNDKAPLDLFSIFHGYDVIEKLGLRKIPPNEIILRPSLLKK